MLGILAVTAVAAAQDAGFWSSLGSNRRIVPCEPSSAAHRAAGQSLERLDGRIEALRETDNPRSVVAELHALLKSECFLMASETDRIPKPSASASLKGWWLDGGRSWLSSYLELPRLGSTDKLVPHVVLPPDVRRTLSSDAQPTHSLRALLCAAGDERCGAGTKGWRQRADTHFAEHARREADPAWRVDDRPSTRPEVAARECAEQTADEPASDRYQRWRACIEERRPRQWALPLGRFEAPTAGWLLISGRRGHYDFCDTTSAFDLATGAAFIYESCSELVLMKGGDVDGGATERGRKERVISGRVPAENLREAAWMMLLREEAEEVQVGAEYYPLPAGLAPAIRRERDSASGSLQSMWMTTGQTRLTWQWVAANQRRFVGDLTWPNSYDAAEDHAASLLAIAEGGLVEGCAPARVPDASTFSAGSAIELNKVDRQSIRELRRELDDAVAKWKSAAVCP